MAYCSVSLTGIAGACDTSKGGLKKVYLANFQEGVFTVEDGAVTGVDSGVTFYEYNFKKGVCSMTSTLNVDPANGVNFVSTELVLQFNKMDTAKRLEISALATGDLVGIAVDANGKYYALGVESPMTATAGTAQTGAARTDGNFYQITLGDEQDSYPMILTAEAIEEIVVSE